MDPKWGERDWPDKIVRAEMEATGFVTAPADGGDKDSTVRSWKNGNGFPSGPNWNALRQALTQYIDPRIRDTWETLLTKAWKAAPANKKSRKTLYEEFKNQNDGMRPLHAAMQKQFEADVAYVDARVQALSHNVAPRLTDAAQAAQLATAYEEKIEILTRGLDADLEDAGTALSRLEARAIVLEKRANLKVWVFDFSGAVTDLSSARDLIPRSNQPEYERLSRILWALVGRDLDDIADFAAAHRQLALFTDLYGTPSVLAYSVLLNLAPDYPKGRAVLDEMIAADVTPNAVTASTMAKLVRSVAEADALTDEMLGFGAANPGFFNTIVSRIHPLLSGAELLGWVFGKAKAFKFPPISAFEPAIVGYRKKQRFDDALRIILPFPHLPTSVAYLTSPGRAKYAEAYFIARYDEGFEPDNASYALAKLHALQNNPERMAHWARIAMTFPEQHTKRRADLMAMLATPHKS